jgi:hypothetical protein
LRRAIFLSGRVALRLAKERRHFLGGGTKVGIALLPGKYGKNDYAERNYDAQHRHEFDESESFTHRS